MTESPSITSSSVLNINVGGSVNYQIATNISAPSFSAYNLPSGLTISPAGLISGSPSLGGEYKISLIAENSTYAATGVLNLIVSDSVAQIISYPAYEVTSNSATLLGDVNQTGGLDPFITVHWGDDDAGVGSWDHNFSLGSSSAGALSHFVSGLLPSTNYYFRFSGNNFDGSNGGLSWSNTQVFTTDSNLSIPVLSPILNVTEPSLIGAKLNAVLLSDGGDANTTVKFYWGENDGGTNPVFWQNSIVFNQVKPGKLTGEITDGLGFPREYFFKVEASNNAGSVWSLTHPSFQKLEMPDLHLWTFPV